MKEKNEITNNHTLLMSGSNTYVDKKHNDSIKIEGSPTLISKYHTAEIKQNDFIVKNAVLMIWSGLGLIIASFVVYVIGLTKSLLAGALCGACIDLFSATILYIFNRSTQNKKQYFNNLTEEERFENVIKMVEEVTDSTKKDDLIKEIVQSVSKRREKRKY